MSLPHVGGFRFFAVVAWWDAVQVVLGVSAVGSVFEVAGDGLFGSFASFVFFAVFGVFGDVGFSAGLAWFDAVADVFEVAGVCAVVDDWRVVVRFA